MKTYVMDILTGISYYRGEAMPNEYTKHNFLCGNEEINFWILLLSRIMQATSSKVHCM